MNQYPQAPATFRSCLQLRNVLVYLCLAIALTWYESGYSTSATVGVTHPETVSRDYSTYRLPSLLAPAPSLPSGTRLRPGSRDDDLPAPLFIGFAAVNAAPSLPALRVDPVAWDSRTPSFLLPSAYGLVPFAIPPPLYLL